MLNGYLQFGHGPKKILAMNGWLGEASDWTSVGEALDKEVFTLVAFDYRGYGRSRHMAGAFSFEESAEDVVRLANHLGWDRFSLIGHSMGGVAIQRVLLAVPQRIDRMLAVAAVPACSSKMDAQRLAMFEGAVADVAARERILDYSTGNRLTSAWLGRMAQRSIERSTEQAFAAYLQQWATVDFSECVKGQQVPVCVLTGEFDPTLTAALMERTWLSWYPNAQSMVIPNAGHYPMFETPLALASIVQGFLGQS